MLKQKLLELREQHDISQNRLAWAIGVSSRAIKHWESGTRVPGTKSLLALANYFNVSVDWLLSDDNENEKE